MGKPHPPEPRRYRSIWISDVHVGTRGCKTEFLLDFLRHHEAENLYLVGDILDFWRLRRGTGAWHQGHNDVIQKLLRKARKGARVVYIPGNHDEAAVDYAGLQFGGVAVALEAVHVTVDGRRLLVTHGHRFDAVVQNARWLARLGSWAYDLALLLNGGLNAARRRLGYPYWSLSAYLKHKVKNAVEFIGDFRSVLAAEARHRGFDGVVCGHIHHPEISAEAGMLYLNCGDWIESCSALVEHQDGRLEIVYWTALQGDEPRHAEADAVAA
jgi:UDP-2,3-diacylglucosamine pyrophosphatase LpxH